VKNLKYIVYLTLFAVPSVIVEMPETENPRTWWYYTLKGTGTGGGEGYFRDIDNAWWRADLIAGIKLAS
jgi:hypothetical protein